MAIIQPTIEVPDDIYTDYIVGNVDIMGLAKNAENARILKHLNLVANNYLEESVESVEEVVTSVYVEDTDSVESSEIEAANNNKLIGVGIVIALVATGVGFWIYHKVNQKKIENLTTCLNAYITAVNDQNLTIEHIDNLINAMDAIKTRKRKKIKIGMSTDQLSALIDCLCNHTKNLANANNIELDEEYTEEETNDVFLKFRKDLIYQKEILQKAA